jgi:hypothetical protein
MAYPGVLAEQDPLAPNPRNLSAATLAFYRDVLSALRDSDVPFLVGGSYALEHYTGIVRETKDLDVFVRRANFDAALRRLADAGCQVETTFPHWLGKAHRPEGTVDLIFSSGNAIAEVDDAWFRYSTRGVVHGVAVDFCPVEEMIWSKAFIMERERFDGADVAHLLRARADHLSWPRLLQRFDRHWPVLFAQLVLFGFVYPAELERIPSSVIDDLIARYDIQRRHPSSEAGLCRGTLLSRSQYLVDVDAWGLRDARLGPDTKMTDADIRLWTDGIAKDGSR